MRRHAFYAIAAVTAVASFAFIFSGITGLVVQQEASMWRPSCLSSQAQPPWQENYNEHGGLMFCMQDNATLYTSSLIRLCLTKLPRNL